MPTTLRSYAKINLGLAIGPTRDDGFHSLLTLYQTIALHDLVTVAARRLPPAAAHSRLSLTSNNPRVPCDARNTAWRMVSSALDHMGIAAEAHIHIEKRLPIQGGMGAGSANAAAALIALERELDQTLPRGERLNLAAHVGSDVPLFLLGGTVLGTGRGELVEPYPDLPAMACVVALPEIGISTPRAFQAWDMLRPLGSGSQGDTTQQLASAYELLRSGAFAKNAPTGWLGHHVINDFEAPVFQNYPSLLEIKRVLAGDSNSAYYCSLSGSGSAIFGLFSNTEDSLKACDRLQRIGVRSISTKTLPRGDYWAKMVEQSTDREKA